MRTTKKKLSQMITTQNIDYTTGEFVEVNKQKVYTVPNEPDYIKLYLKDLVKLKNLPPSANNILYMLLQNMDYQNRIYITPTIRKSVIARLAIAEITLKKAIASYIKKGLLNKLDNVTYLTNPEIFGRGSWQNVKEIRMLVSYSEKGRLLLNYEEYQKKIASPELPLQFK